jgi:hypothetical protein
MSQSPLITILLAGLALRSDPNVHKAGNDTDAVVERGLFPLGRQNPPLTLLSETVRVSVGPNAVTTSRVYRIRNDGASAAVQLATICGTNQLDADCGQIRLGAASPASQRHVGYLVDSGGSVTIRPTKRSEIEECLKHLDGNVCGHEWTTHAIRIEPGESVEASLQYHTPFDTEYWIDGVLAPLHLYTEKFWYGDSVPKVTVWAEVPGGKFSLQSWTPRGPYAQYSHPPTGEANGAIYWRLDGYRPVKKQYTYAFRLLHPNSVDHHSIRAAYDEAMAKAHPARRQHR